MANLFALILTIATLITGILWCLERFIYLPRRRAEAALLAQRAASEATAAGAENLPEQNSEQPVAETPPKQGWRETLASLFPVLALVLIVRSFIYEPFQIPSGSMMPTLLVGDFILVEKFAYGIKDPLLQKTLIKTGEPKRGDIAVFKYPKDPSLDYIKRVIGLPGDRISYDPFNKVLTVQPHCDDNATDCQSLAVTYSDVQAADYVFTLPTNNNYHNGEDQGENKPGMYSLPLTENKANSIRVNQRMETLGKVSHHILLIPEINPQYDRYWQQPGQPANSWVVPAGHYFMMGDNRDNSEDSRYWGFVPEKNLVGKATFIWMSFKKREGEWPTGVRLQRIGSIH